MCILEDSDHKSSHKRWIKTLEEFREHASVSGKDLFAADVPGILEDTSAKFLSKLKSYQSACRKQMEEDVEKRYEASQSLVFENYKEKISGPILDIAGRVVRAVSGVGEWEAGGTAKEEVDRYVEWVERKNEEDGVAFDTCGRIMQRVKHQILYNKEIERMIREDLERLTSKYVVDVDECINKHFFLDERFACLEKGDTNKEKWEGRNGEEGGDESIDIDAEMSIIGMEEAKKREREVEEEVVLSRVVKCLREKILSHSETRVKESQENDEKVWLKEGIVGAKGNDENKENMVNGRSTWSREKIARESKALKPVVNREMGSLPHERLYLNDMREMIKVGAAFESIVGIYEWYPVVYAMFRYLIGSSLFYPNVKCTSVDILLRQLEPKNPTKTLRCCRVCDYLDSINRLDKTEAQKMHPIEELNEKQSKTQVSKARIITRSNFLVFLHLYATGEHFKGTSGLTVDQAERFRSLMKELSVNNRKTGETTIQEEYDLYKRSNEQSKERYSKLYQFNEKIMKVYERLKVSGKDIVHIERLMKWFYSRNYAVPYLDLQRCLSLAKPPGFYDQTETELGQSRSWLFRSFVREWDQRVRGNPGKGL